MEIIIICILQNIVFNYSNDSLEEFKFFTIELFCMKNILDALNGNDQVELDLTVPSEREDEFKKVLNIRYGDFHNGCWQAEEPKNNKVVLHSPTITVDTARRIDYTIKSLWCLLFSK